MGAPVPGAARIPDVTELPKSAPDEVAMAPPQARSAVVIGAGPTGLASALALAAVGVDVALAAPPFEAAQASADTRTTALLLSSIELLKNLGAWDLVAHESQELRAIRIVDDTGGLLRAPEVSFRAAELGLASFGANLANSHLLQALARLARAHPRIAWHATTGVSGVMASVDGVRVALTEGGVLTASLLIGADGARSLARRSAGIGAKVWSYPQLAVCGAFAHARAHDDTTIELQRRAGPLTLVPLKERRSSFVWVEEPEEAARLAGLGEAAFLSELYARTRGVLGPLCALSPCARYPLRGLSAERMAGARTALVGEAAHVIPPIGAQGLNLSLRDAASLAECVAKTCAQGGDIGGARTLAAYEAARASDVASRTLLIDLINRSLLSPLSPLAAARGVLLHLFANSQTLRRAAMRLGLEPPGPLPPLMRPGAAAP